MNRYRVSYIRCYNYVVAAENEDEAKEVAHSEFKEDCCYPIADTIYDELSVECIEENMDEVKEEYKEFIEGFIECEEDE